MSNYSSNGFRDDGFTILELIMVIVIIGIVASVAVTKFNDLTENANTAQCDANRGAIASSVAITYADTLVQDPTAVDWLENTTMDDVQADWFATGGVPGCPVSGSFTLTEGNVTCSEHVVAAQGGGQGGGRGGGGGPGGRGGGRGGR